MLMAEWRDTLVTRITVADDDDLTVRIQMRRGSGELVRDELREVFVVNDSSCAAAGSIGRPRVRMERESNHGRRLAIDSKPPNNTAGGPSRRCLSDGMA